MLSRGREREANVTWIEKGKQCETERGRKRGETQTEGLKVGEVGCFRRSSASKIVYWLGADLRPSRTWPLLPQKSQVQG